MRRAVTLIEMMIVIIIIGAAAAVTFFKFNRVKEAALDKEAISSLKLMQEAEKLHYMELNSYYPFAPGGSTSDIRSINQYLKLNLPNEASPKWNYTVKSTASTFCVQARRNDTGGRYFRLQDTDTGEPPAAACP